MGLKAIYFSAQPNCSGCTAFEPTWNNIKQESEFSAYTFEEKNVKNPDDAELVTWYQVDGGPTVVLDGGNMPQLLENPGSELRRFMREYAAANNTSSSGGAVASLFFKKHAFHIITLAVIALVLVALLLILKKNNIKV